MEGTEASGNEGLTPQEKAGADVIQAGGSRENAGLGSLFGEAAPSEAELRGEVKPSDSEKSEIAPPGDGDSKGDVTAKGDNKTSEADVKEAGDTQETPPAKADKEDKPESKGRPEGYVPLAALHEERAARKQLQNTLKDLEEKIKSLESSKTEKVEKGEKSETVEEFKVLTKEEFKELSDNDIFAAIQYQQDLIEYKEKVARKERDEESQKKEIERASRRETETINKVADKIRDLVPGIYDDESEINTNLTAFAISQGFNPEYVPLLTHPGTKIIPPGSTKPVLLGDGAAAIIGVLHKFYTSETDLRSRLEKEITEKIQTEVMDKLKGDVKFKSIGDVPGTADKLSGSKRLSEAELANLSEVERQKYLGG